MRLFRRTRPAARWVTLELDLPGRSIPQIVTLPVLGKVRIPMSMNGVPVDALTTTVTVKSLP